MFFHYARRDHLATITISALTNALFGHCLMYLGDTLFSRGILEHKGGSELVSDRHRDQDLTLKPKEYQFLQYFVTEWSFRDSLSLLMRSTLGMIALGKSGSNQRQ